MTESVGPGRRRTTARQLCRYRSEALCGRKLPDRMIADLKRPPSGPKQPDNPGRPPGPSGPDKNPPMPPNPPFAE